jgi:hypothetical protein
MIDDENDDDAINTINVSDEYGDYAMNKVSGIVTCARVCTTFFVVALTLGTTTYSPL